MPALSLLPEFTGAAERPNIIFILSDDLAQGDVGCYGQKLIQTPNLDRMAREGTRFTQAYCGTTVCAPSRTSLMTGLHTGHSPVRANWEIAPGEGQLPLPAETVTVAQMLKDAGYATACVGKWGMGMFDTTGSPLKKGFDHFFGYNCQRHAHSYFPTYLYRDAERFELPGNDGKGSRPDVRPGADPARRRAMAAEPTRSGRSSCSTRSRCRTAGTRSTTSASTRRPIGRRSRRPTRRRSRGSMRTSGRILALLKELKLDENTLVMLAGDNGSSFDEKSEIGTPLRPVDGRQAARLQAEHVRRRPAAGGARALARSRARRSRLRRAVGVLGLPADRRRAGRREAARRVRRRDGLSLAAMLKGGPAPQRDYFYWELHEASFIQAVRFGDWKAVRNGPSKPIELYDLKTDAGETQDVASRHADLVAKAESLMKSAHRDDPNWPIFENQRQRNQWRRSRRVQ